MQNKSKHEIEERNPAKGWITFNMHWILISTNLGVSFISFPRLIISSQSKEKVGLKPEAQIGVGYLRLARRATKVQRGDTKNRSYDTGGKRIGTDSQLEGYLLIH
jgi:hypothetical protein